ncbi:hypothetical protein ACE193_15315 [Bernardetia sp. OM2101]|uniref:hypothetical protein n=1 Tax=Bernardetia sp. OM2101 TaxID=3344876 RepID=UPI0035CEFBB3
MKESQLKIVLQLLEIDWSEFVKFIAHKTISMLGTETYYYQSDIDHFLLLQFEARRDNLLKHEKLNL